MPLKVIITGATGMVGEGVLHECLLSPDVEKVLVVSRRTMWNTLIRNFLKLFFLIFLI